MPDNMPDDISIEQKAYIEALSKREDENQELEERISDTTRMLYDKSKELEEIENKGSGLKNKIEETKAEISYKTEELEEIETKGSGLENKIEETKAEISHKTEELEEIEIKRGELEKEIDLIRDAEHLRDELESYENELSEVENRKEKIEEEQKQLSESLENYKNEISQLPNEKKLKKELKKISASLKDYERELSSIESKKSKLEEDHNQLYESLENYKNEQTNLAREIEELKKKCSVYDVSIGGSSRLDNTYVGVGGCGCEILLRLIKDRIKNSIKEGTDWMYLYDLSVDLDDIESEIKDLIVDDEFKNYLDHIVSIRPVVFRGGAGRVPKYAELVLDYKHDYDNMYNPYVSIYFHSLGGGTGSGTVPNIILKRKEKGGVHIEFSVITETINSKLELINHLYTFPKINKAANFVILVENDRMTEIDASLTPIERSDLTDKYIIKIVNILNAARQHPDAYPRHDWSNFISQMKQFQGYRDEVIKWFIPFLWPISVDEYETDTTKTIWQLIENAMNSGSLCRVNEVKKCDSAILIIEVPSNLNEEGKNESNRRISAQIDKAIYQLINVLGLKDIIYAIIPSKGFKICLLLYGIPFKKLDELKGISADTIRNSIIAWNSKVDEDIKILQDIVGVTEDNIKKLRDEIDNFDLYKYFQDFIRSYENYCRR